MMSDNSIQIIANSIPIIAFSAILIAIIVSRTLIALARIKADKEKAIARSFGKSLKNIEFESDEFSVKDGKAAYISPKNKKNDLIEFITSLRKK